MPLVVPGINSASGGQKGDWENKLVGKKLSESTTDTTNFAKRDLPKEHRVVGHDSSKTMDYKPDRLNLYTNKDGIVTSVNYGPVNDTKKKLALAIIDFLSTSLKDGTVSSEDSESIEIAQSCIADSFHVDQADKVAVEEALGGQSLLGIYSVYEKLKGKSSTTASASGSSSGSTPAPKAAAASPQRKQEAESLKGQGNSAMAKKDYPAAIELYTKAIDIDPANAIYLSNRAAAYSASHQQDKARTDAEAAVASDPKYTKAWSRLGLARFALGDAKGSMEAYQKGIDYEGNGGSEAMKKGFETARRKVNEDNAAGDAMDDVTASRSAGPGAGAGGMPDLSGLASMLGGGGGGGGGGGPDLAGLMNNPMFANMAQNLMSNPQMMQNIMNNPKLRDVANSLGGGGGGGAGGPSAAGRGGGGGGGGAPDLASLMQDPSIAEMAKSFMGGGAGGGAGGAGRGAPPGGA
ncbi:MAG: hypothetical protein M1825_006526 [Sarcosagium campestre]|nr:MAG: hypothetical protein M1825_006526 [Sarcosagium campestre]